MNGYSRAYASNKYEGMSAERLILELYDGVLRNIDLAQQALERGDVARKCDCISRAIAIVAELQSALNPEAGEVVGNLEALYDYSMRVLSEANVRCEATPLEEAKRVMKPIREGWAEMLQTQVAPLRAAAGAERRAQNKGYL